VREYERGWCLLCEGDSDVDICSRITIDLLMGGGKLSELRKIIHMG
jgi:hypothetical protein